MVWPKRLLAGVFCSLVSAKFAAACTRIGSLSFDEQARAAVRMLLVADVGLLAVIVALDVSSKRISLLAIAGAMLLAIHPAWTVRFGATLSCNYPQQDFSTYSALIMFALCGIRVLRYWRERGDPTRA